MMQLVPSETLYFDDDDEKDAVSFTTTITASVINLQRFFEKRVVGAGKEPYTTPCRLPFPQFSPEPYP